MAVSNSVRSGIGLLACLLTFCQRPPTVQGAGSRPRSVQTPSQTNAMRLESAKTLTETDVKLLINDFNAPRNREALPMDSWLLTGHTRETDVLLKHVDTAYPLLIAALRDPSVDVRRYSAFCIGELHRRDAIPELQAAIRAELARSLKAQQAGQHWPLAGLHAMLRAYAAIDRRGLVTWLLNESFPEDQTAVINSELESWLLHGGPRCESLPVESCRRQWIEYWRESSGKSDKHLFE